MQLYSDALDEYYFYNQFLNLWNIAETICFPDGTGVESKKVTNRLAWFGKNIGLVSSGYTKILESLALKRNNLVHRGISDIDNDDVNHLKFAIDTALLWIFRSCVKIKNSFSIKSLL